MASEHPKKADCLADLMLGLSPRQVSEKHGVPWETVRGYAKRLNKPGGLAKAAEQVNPEQPNSVFNRLRQVFEERVDADIAVSRFISGKQESKYLNRQPIDGVAQFQYSNLDRTAKLGAMLEDAEEDAPLTVEGREILDAPAIEARR